MTRPPCSRPTSAQPGASSVQLRRCPNAESRPCTNVGGPVSARAIDPCVPGAVAIYAQVAKIRWRHRQRLSRLGNGPPGPLGGVQTDAALHACPQRLAALWFSQVRTSPAAYLRYRPTRKLRGPVPFQFIWYSVLTEIPRNVAVSSWLHKRSKSVTWHSSLDLCRSDILLCRIDSGESFTRPHRLCQEDRAICHIDRDSGADMASDLGSYPEPGRAAGAQRDHARLHPIAFCRIDSRCLEG